MAMAAATSNCSQMALPQCSATCVLLPYTFSCVLAPSFCKAACGMEHEQLDTDQPFDMKTKKRGVRQCTVNSVK
jgi:hypothetical protein